MTAPVLVVLPPVTDMRDASRRRRPPTVHPRSLLALFAAERIPSFTTGGITPRPALNAVRTDDDKAAS